MLDYKLDATIAKIELEAVLEGAPATVTCCREWAILPHWGNPKSVGLQYDYEPVVRLGPGEQYHCRYCGARFTLLPSGEVQVGPSAEKLLAGYRRAVEDLCDGLSDYDECPSDLGYTCPLGVDNCRRASGQTGKFCWLVRWELATTYAEAAELWKRMEEVGA